MIDSQQLKKVVVVHDLIWKIKLSKNSTQGYQHALYLVSYNVINSLGA